MNTYVILIRGINVGGINKVPMAALKKCLEELGFEKVATHLASGNVILESDQAADKIKAKIEKALPERFKLDSEILKVLVLTRKKFEAVIDKKPDGFGEQPKKYHSDVIFLVELEMGQALSVLKAREGVDQHWHANGVIYYQRLTAQRTKTYLSKVFATPEYKSMTVRSWATTIKLLDMLKKADA